MKYRFYYAGIRVKNLRRSLAFYSKALGMKVVNRGTMGHGGKYVQLVGPGSRQKLELNWYPPGSRFRTPYRKGATPAVSPEKSEGTEVYVKDPDGIWIELLD